MTSPNLSIPHVAAAQNQKEVTINDAVDALDDAMNRALSLAMTDEDLALAPEQASRHGLVVLTGTISAPRVLTLPALHRRLAIRNATGGGHEIRVSHAGSAVEVVVAPGATVLVQGDGSDLFGVGGGAGALADLTDVDAGAAGPGDLLRYDGAYWGAMAAGIFQRALLPFRGALVRRTTDFSVSTTGAYVAVPWQAVEYDSDDFWEAGEPTRLTVPAGVTRIRMVGNIEWQTSPISQLVEIRKNGNSVLGGGSFIVRGDGGYSNQMRNLSSAVLPVSAGDWFELAVYAGTAGALRSLERTWLAIEVVETEDAADPPADLFGYKAGVPDANEELLRVPVARRSRLKVNLAGSHASAAVAATAETDLDIQHNAASFATMRFAAAATSATFIAASETVLEPGDIVSVVAPFSPDATLAGIGFTLAGTLVL